jgi:hypothetical protein
MVWQPGDVDDPVRSISSVFHPCRSLGHPIVAAAAMLLLFIGIHNAWDAVTYHVYVNKRQQEKAERR